MFTDMVGYTTLAQRNEALALELLQEHHDLLRAILPMFEGGEIKSTGDGLLVEFPSALAAVRCAVEIQRKFADRNETKPEERHIRIRIGIHLGDVVRRGNDVLGDGVNIAARIEPLAEPGGICISNSVHDQIENKISHPLVRLSRPELKNIQASVQVYKLVLGGARPHASFPPNRRRNAGAFAVVVILALSLLLLLKFGGRPKPEVAANTPPGFSATTNAAHQKSIAVLPFVNMSADKADEYLSDGMTEELLNTLTRIKGLRVPGRSSSFSFKGKNEEDIFRKVGEQLHVGVVLEGSVRKAGNQLRITAQLISVADGFHLWSETYDRDMTNIFAIQSDIAERVADALKVELGVEETQALAKQPTENAEAYRLYLLGRYHFATMTQSGWTNAMHYYNQALQLDPGYALAYCGLADNYGWMGGLVMPGREAWAKEKEMAQKAIALDSNLADAHLSLGLALFGAFDWVGGESGIKRALELNPNLALAHDQYAWLLTVFGRFDEAIAKQKKALELDPLSSLMNYDLAWWLVTARRYEAAVTQIHNTLELDPNHAGAHELLGWCLVWKGNIAGAIAEFRKSKALDDAPNIDGDLGYAYAVSGDRAAAEEILRGLTDLAKHRYVSPAPRVTVYLGLGEMDTAFYWLNKCYEDHDSACWDLKSSRLYDSMRNEPPFQALLKKVGLD